MFWITCPCCKRKGSSNTWAKHDPDGGSEICVYCRWAGCRDTECRRAQAKKDFEALKDKL